MKTKRTRAAKPTINPYAWGNRVLEELTKTRIEIMRMNTDLIKLHTTIIKESTDIDRWLFIIAIGLVGISILLLFILIILTAK